MLCQSGSRQGFRRQHLHRQGPKAKGRGGSQAGQGVKRLNAERDSRAARRSGQADGRSTQAKENK
ncbi:hypothetical protein E2562_016184 [Oryza meyeriana var. granulata]|uniref:Uncharacterized protein n=1 Tax=Oryza meyeriana var. granulata TaxID=110450 RepID=A0A6G1CRV3_9ORYZ|nr:hypothetical protein E2562_016184 [Oryza meyeriana var. granulata]